LCSCIPLHYTVILPHSSSPPPALHPFPTRRSSDRHPEPPHPAGKGQRFRPSGGRHDELHAEVAPVPDSGDRQPTAAAVSARPPEDRKSTRLNSSHVAISYAVFCLKKKNRALETVTA